MRGRVEPSPSEDDRDPSVSSGLTQLEVGVLLDLLDSSAATGEADADLAVALAVVAQPENRSLQGTEPLFRAAWCAATVEAIAGHLHDAGNGARLLPDPGGDLAEGRSLVVEPDDGPFDRTQRLTGH